MNERDLEATLRAVQEQLAALTERIAALEAAGTAGTAAADPAPAVPDVVPRPATTGAAAAASVAAESEGLDEETLLVISAAIAAYLGKKAHIRQVRLVNSATWVQQGRVGIHTSHAIAVHSRAGAAS